MKNVVYFIVHILCAVPTIVMFMALVLCLMFCFDYHWLCALVPVFFIVMYKCSTSYSKDVISVLKFINAIKDDVCD